MDELKAAVQDLAARYKAVHDQVPTEAKIREIVSSVLNVQEEKGASARLVQAQAGGDANTKGTRYGTFGLKSGDVQFLHDLMCGTKDGPSEELRNAYKSVSARYIPDHRPDAVAPLYTKSTLNEGAAGYGAQLIGVQYVQELWEAARQESQIFANLESFVMTAPSANLPIEADMPEPYFLGENTSDNTFLSATARPGSRFVAVSAKKMIWNLLATGELVEDSLIPMVPYMRAQVARALAFYADSVILNGDTTTAATGNINSDDAAPTATKFYLAFDGIRKAALVDNTANASDFGGGPSVSLLSALRNKMIDRTYLQDWSNPVNRSDLVFVCDPATYHTISALDAFRAVNEYGPDATILRGEIGSIFGHPVIRTLAVGLTEADGKVSATAANNTKGQIVLFNRNGFKVGIKSDTQISLVNKPDMDQLALVARIRMGLGRYAPSGSVGSIECAAVGYNITV